MGDIPTFRLYGDMEGSMKMDDCEATAILYFSSSVVRAPSNFTVSVRSTVCVPEILGSILSRET